MESILKLIASFLAVVVVLTLHEFAHAFVAYKCGDPTPKWNRRLTLNPARHFDLMGLIFFTLVGFGWAKPVPVNPDNFKKYRLGKRAYGKRGRYRKLSFGIFILSALYFGVLLFCRQPNILFVCAVRVYLLPVCIQSFFLRV